MVHRTPRDKQESAETGEGRAARRHPRPSCQTPPQRNFMLSAQFMVQGEEGGEPTGFRMEPNIGNLLLSRASSSWFQPHWATSEQDLGC